MSIDIPNLFQIKLTATYLEVGRREDTNVKRFPIVNEHPLSEVKLFLTFDAKRLLDVLLHNFLLRFFRISQDFSQLPGAIDAETSSIVRWFNNPNIMSAVNLPILGQQSFQYIVKAYKFELFVRGKAGSRNTIFD